MTDIELIETYMLGWQYAGEPTWEKLKEREDFNSDIEYKAWYIGYYDYIAGDDVSSVDMQSEEQILKRIKYDSGSI